MLYEGNGGNSTKLPRTATQLVEGQSNPGSKVTPTTVYLTSLVLYFLSQHKSDQLKKCSTLGVQNMNVGFFFPHMLSFKKCLKQGTVAKRGNQDAI